MKRSIQWSAFYALFFTHVWFIIYFCHFYKTIDTFSVEIFFKFSIFIFAAFMLYLLSFLMLKVFLYVCWWNAYTTIMAHILLLQVIKNNWMHWLPYACNKWTNSKYAKCCSFSSVSKNEGKIIWGLFRKWLFIVIVNRYSELWIT